MQKYRRAFFVVKAIIVGLVVAVLLRLLIIQPVRVNGDSMSPNLIDQESVMVLKHQHIRRFAVVAFNGHGVIGSKPDRALIVKRVIGLPGDRIRYTQNGNLYVNGHLQPQTFVSQYQRQQGTTSAVNTHGFTLKQAALRYSWQNQWSRQFRASNSMKIPRNCYFVLGDNRSLSDDSRQWGFVPKSKIVGVAKVASWDQRAAIINDYR